MRVWSGYIVAGMVFVLPVIVRAAHQTNTVSPVHVGSSYPYQIDVQPYDFGAADLPTLQSFAAGKYDGKWVMLAGRTNGLHGFVNGGAANFPASSQNRDVWVVDPISRQSWHRSLATDSGVSATLLAELSSTNTEHMQIGDRLYVAGGYGLNAGGSFQTFNGLSSVDLAGLTNWVMTGAGSAADSIRTIHDETFRVTGGAMLNSNGHARLVFGQNFIGGYNPNANGAYTKQVRSFDILDDGVNLGITNATSTAPLDAYRRRDLNVFPTLHRNADNSITSGLTALSGVFTDTFGAWTVPVQVDQNGQTSMADPSAPATFKQAMNNYECAKLGLFSESQNQMHEVLFGGITLQFYDPVSQTFQQDDNLPFTSQITQINITGDGTDGGQYSQDLIGEFPNLMDQDGRRLLLGSNAEFFAADGIPTYPDGIIRLDALTGPTVLGYVFGGIFSNAPNTRGVTGAVSGASNDIFQVIYTPVPEPGLMSVLLVGMAVWLRFHRMDRQEKMQCVDANDL